MFKSEKNLELKSQAKADSMVSSYSAALRTLGLV